MKKKNKSSCEEDEHDWEFARGWKNNLDFDGFMLYIPLVCTLCKVKGYESYRCCGQHVEDDEE